MVNVYHEESTTWMLGEKQTGGEYRAISFFITWVVASEKQTVGDVWVGVNRWVVDNAS